MAIALAGFNAFSTLANPLTEITGCDSGYIARFELSKHTNALEQQHSAITSSSFERLKLGQRLAHVDTANQVIDIWYQNQNQNQNQQVQLTRIFEHYHQGIEYQPTDLQLSQTQDKPWQLVPTQLFKQMKKVSTSGQGCQRTEVYELTTDHQVVRLTWLPELTLPQQFSITDQQKTMSSTLALTQLAFDQKTLNQRFSHWDDVRLTDFADIGDNEQNPVLNKMIKQGFSLPEVGHHH
ncbi:hypothetical protein [Colwellia sp. MEBiC06753]